MSKPSKPIIHGRDHEHGGADPARIVYETVGGSGGGGAAPLTTLYKHSSDPMSAGGGLTSVAFTKTAGTDLLDLTTPTAPTFLADAVYSASFSARDSAFLAATKALYLSLSSAFAGGGTGFVVETEQTVPSTVAGSFSATVTSPVFFAHAGDDLSAVIAQSGGGSHSFYLGIYVTKM